jgi:hypothetical protein
MSGVRPTIYTVQPSEDGERWYVWDIYTGLPPKPVFVGTMEEAYAVSDALNKRTANLSS